MAKAKKGSKENTIIRGSGGRKVKTQNGKFIALQLNLDHLLQLVEDLGDEYIKKVKFKEGGKQRLVEINLSPSKYENQDFYMTLKPVFIPKRTSDGSPIDKKSKKKKKTRRSK